MSQDDSANSGPAPKAPDPLDWPRSLTEARQRLRQLWYGEIPLAQTFWLYCFVIIFILKLLSKTQGTLGAFFDVLGLAWAGFMVKPIMTAADKYNGDKIWAVLAKVTAVVIAVAVLTALLSM